MKQLSAGMIKRGRMGLDDFRKPLPREGSELRRIYDLLWEHRGEFVELHAFKNKSLLTQLRDMYGLNIRTMFFGAGRGSGIRGKYSTLYMLAGEYVEHGRYVDYIQQRAEGRIKIG